MYIAIKNTKEHKNMRIICLSNLALNPGFDIVPNIVVIMRTIAGRRCGGRVRRPCRARGARGQTAVEYAIVSGIMVLLAVVMGLLLTVFNEYGQRLLEIIASDYP